MAGGIGERLWPKSRPSVPKQLQKIYSNKTLLRETIDRALTITTLDRVFIGTSAYLKKKILESEKSFPKENFILEPESKNTAPIIALSSLYFQQKFGNPTQVILSADAFIEPAKEFTKNIKLAISIASDCLVLLGILPSRPETGYGYISAGNPKNNVCEVKGFFEKPDLKNAKKYFKKKNFYWNPGIFIWKTEFILNQFQKHSPHILKPLLSKFPFKQLNDLNNAFKLIPSESIDVAIMEKSSEIRMIQASFQWDDVGSWLSLSRITNLDNAQNAQVGKNVHYFDSFGNISSTQKELTVFLGVNDLIVVEESDVLFIANKDSISNIKQLLSEMKKNRSLQKYLD